ncbi:MAG: molybdenum cofactor guanylyltransferase [Halobacteria archaeon]|nr:molybdenum cofactor guanylyltransferase [Halobacteria archaeon]
MADAVVLAGGFSTRFGEDDKATAKLDGDPLISHVVDSVSDVETVETVIINTRPRQTSEIRSCLGLGSRDGSVEIEFAEDDEPGLGPVGGVLTGMEKAESEYAAVVACDMPLLSPDLFEYLLGESRRLEADAAVPRLDGWLQTTHAVYRRSATLEACETSLTQSTTDTQTSMRRTLEDLDYISVDEDEVLKHASQESFVNVNTRSDLERIRD